MWPNPQEIADLVTFTVEILILPAFVKTDIFWNVSRWPLKCVFIQNWFKYLRSFAKNSILDARLGSEYASGCFHQKLYFAHIHLRLFLKSKFFFTTNKTGVLLWWLSLKLYSIVLAIKTGVPKQKKQNVVVKRKRNHVGSVNGQLRLL